MAAAIFQRTLQLPIAVLRFSQFPPEIVPFSAVLIHAYSLLFRGVALDLPNPQFRPAHHRDERGQNQ